MAKVKTLKVKDYLPALAECPNFSASGSIRGMKKLYYGKDALLVKCGAFIYNVTSRPEIYDIAK